MSSVYHLSIGAEPQGHGPSYERSNLKGVIYRSTVEGNEHLIERILVEAIAGRALVILDADFKPIATITPGGPA